MVHLAEGWTGPLLHAAAEWNDVCRACVCVCPYGESSEYIYSNKSLMHSYLSLSQFCLINVCICIRVCVRVPERSRGIGFHTSAKEKLSAVLSSLEQSYGREWICQVALGQVMLSAFIPRRFTVSTTYVCVYVLQM